MSYSADLHLPQIKSADACRAIGCTPQWLKNVVSRTPRVVLLQEDERVQLGERQFLSLSLSSVLHLTLVNRLAKTFDIRRAHQYASTFTYFGAPAARRAPERFPGSLYRDGRTYLFADPEMVVGEVVFAPPDKDVVTFFFEGTHGRGVGHPVVIIDVTRVDAEVRLELGMSEG